MTRFEPSGPLSGTLRPPPDKSISHRAAILAAMAEGRSKVSAYLDSADTRSALEAVRALGADVDELGSQAPGALDLRIDGIGLRGPGHNAGANPLVIDVGNAGTLLRLLPGWLAGQDAGRGVWTATSRSGAGRWTGSSHRCARWARALIAGTIVSLLSMCGARP